MSSFPLFNGNPGGIHEYLRRQRGVQLSTRFDVTIQSRTSGTVNFMCDMAQIPSKKVKIYQDILSGTSSPIPIPFGLNYNTNLFQFITEESWISRKYFEDWQSSIFVDAYGNPSDIPIRVNLLEEVARNIQIQALSTAGTGSARIPTAIITLNECIPLEVVPAKFDAAAYNTPVRFSVNMFYRSYSLLRVNK